MTPKNNNLVKWIIVALAVAGLIFNSGVLYNDVKHLKTEMVELKQQIGSIQEYLLKGK